MLRGAGRRRESVVVRGVDVAPVSMRDKVGVPAERVGDSTGRLPEAKSSIS